MKLAFLLYHYFPYGGLQRDMLAMALACASRGHQVTVYTHRWLGERPAPLHIKELAVSGWSNPGRLQSFASRCQQQLAKAPVDLVIGFNKMPGLDIYFAADTCFAHKAFAERSWFYRQSWRCRGFLRLEQAVFAPQSATRIMFIAAAQRQVFSQYYSGLATRSCLLPPGIKRERVMPANYPELRHRLRQHYGLVQSERLLLMVGSDFARKGVALGIAALAQLPPELRACTQLWVAGQGNPHAYLNLARQLGVAGQVKMLGARDDVAQLMWAADVLLHPAQSEAAGAVLLEAAVAGLPVIAADVCGYAEFIGRAQLGRVLSQEQLRTQLACAISEVLAQDPQLWWQRSAQLCAQVDVFSMVDTAVDYIESIARSNPAG